VNPIEASGHRKGSATGRVDPPDPPEVVDCSIEPVTPPIAVVDSSTGAADPGLVGWSETVIHRYNPAQHSYFDPDSVPYPRDGCSRMAGG